MSILKTERRNPKTTHIDKMDLREMVQVINEENYNAVRAVEAETENIVKAIALVVEGFQKGGRLFYVGAGTSGRIGVLDAAECPPTYGVPEDMVIGIMAGGEACLSRAGESNEDSQTEGVEALRGYAVNEKDVVVGLSVAGGAQFVNCAVEYARSVGAKTVGITSNDGSKLSQIVDIAICPDTGAEVIAGSTRMKAGTSQKLILNTISTCAMVKCGCVYENLMVNIKPTNIKATKRMLGIVCEIIGCDEETAKDALDKNEWSIPKAVEALR